jgi:glycosyltransferase involved in cell wall biosynthesis
MQEYHPKISIIIPVYNGKNFLAQAIDSAIAQTYKNIEILVINDGSNDGGATEKIALSYGDKIRYYFKPNDGVASALNWGVARMTGDFFSWLSHDDLYTTDKIEYQIRSLTKMDGNRNILYSDYMIFSNEPDQSIPMYMQGVHPDNFRHWITIENTLHGCTLLIPKDAFSECGVFNEMLKTVQDYDLWFRMAEKYRFCHVPHFAVKSRRHSAQGSKTMRDVALDECNGLLSGFLSKLAPDEIKLATRQSLALAYANIAISMWARGFYPVGVEAAKLSVCNFTCVPLRDALLSLLILFKGIILHYNKRLFIKTVLMKALSKINNIFVIEKIHTPYTIDLKDKFTEVYRKNLFGGRESFSGEGSGLEQTTVIRKVLPGLLKGLEVHSIMDAPCGDCYWMRHIDLQVEKYIGVDIVEAVIKKNQIELGSDKSLFFCMNLTDSLLPKVDLILSRDCLVHLSYADALKAVDNFKRSGAKYLLTTTFTKRTENEDLGKDFWRPLNLQLPPFNFPLTVRVINEECTEGNGLYTDKSLGLWLLSDINLD